MIISPLYFLFLEHQLNIEHPGLIIYVLPFKNAFYTPTFVSAFYPLLWEIFLNISFEEHLKQFLVFRALSYSFVKFS